MSERCPECDGTAVLACMTCNWRKVETIMLAAPAAPQAETPAARREAAAYDRGLRARWDLLQETRTQLAAARAENTTLKALAAERIASDDAYINRLRDALEAKAEPPAKKLDTAAARAAISEFRDYMRQVSGDFKRRDEMVMLLHAFVDAYEQPAMTERFSDALLLRVIIAYKSHADDQSSINAMRAVMEAARDE